MPVLPVVCFLTHLLFFHSVVVVVPPPSTSGTYLTNEAKGADDAPDADTAIINAEGNHAHTEEKKEYFI